MRVDPALVFPPPAAPPADGAQVRSDVPGPVPGQSSTTENGSSPNQAAPPEAAQDEVNVQWDSENQIRIYRFLDRQGDLVMQVPSEQMVNLAREIQQQLLQEAAAHRATGNGGGKPNGH